MSVTKAEQIDRHERPRPYKRDLKTRVVRARRRAEKLDLENAPRQVRELIRGYSS